ncbi:hypothetical protein PSYAC_26357, partial [Pseudomonas syringae pv. actinidiae str. M302091]
TTTLKNAGAFELHDQSLSFGNAQPVGADNVTGAGDARTITWLPDDCECRRLIQFLTLRYTADLLNRLRALYYKACSCFALCL